MQRHLHSRILVYGIICMAAGACAKSTSTSETYPAETIGKNYVFNNLDSLGTYAQQFLNSTYAKLPQGYNRISNNILDAGTDDAIPSSVNSPVEGFSTGRIIPSSLPDNQWNNEYAGIRQVNIFLSQLKNVPLNIVGQKAQWIAQARGLRAIFYFELVKRWGGVPLLGDTVYNVTDVVDPPRNTFNQCMQYISSELDTAAAYLPVSYSSTYFGSLTGGAAMAMKARMLLYAASPLNNPQNDPAQWQTAAAAAQAVISTGTYSLDTWSNVFFARQNKEVIFAYYIPAGHSVEQYDGPVGSPRGDLGYTSPTQELVDEYETAGGLMITDPASGYDPQDPYANRDPRLALTVFCNGASWLGRTVQTYDGGVDRPYGYGNATSGQTRTGYYMSKFLSNSGTPSSYTNVEHDFPIIRYAEVLLDFAEAANESSGPTAAVYAAVNSIRQRAGLNPYALPPALTQDQMRQRIRHERRVELAFEEQRFWDIRRWHTADSVLNGTLHGVQITGGTSGSLAYTIVPADNVIFNASRMYLYPIPFQEMVSNPNMVQNPNW